MTTARCIHCGQFHGERPPVAGGCCMVLARERDEAREQLADAMEKVERYRALRRHVRKDGRLKARLPKDIAEREAARLTEIHGRTYTAYPCPLCSGMWHTGCLRDEFNPPNDDTENQ